MLRDLPLPITPAPGASVPYSGIGHTHKSGAPAPTHKYTTHFFLKKETNHVYSLLFSLDGDLGTPEVL